MTQQVALTLLLLLKFGALISNKCKIVLPVQDLFWNAKFLDPIHRPSTRSFETPTDQGHYTSQLLDHLTFLVARSRWGKTSFPRHPFCKKRESDSVVVLPDDHETRQTILVTGLDLLGCVTDHLGRCLAEWRTAMLRRSRGW